MKWYYTDEKSKIMYCEYCVLDDQFSRITTTDCIVKLSQNVSCFYCGWCPKTDGLIRPSSKKSKYLDQVQIGS